MKPMMRTDRYIHKSGFTLLLAGVLAGCSFDKELVNERAGTDVAFTMQFGGTATRATTLDNIWPDNSEIYIKSTSEASTPLASETYKYKTAANSSSAASGAAVVLTPVAGTFRWPDVDPEWKFTAWYPATSDSEPTTGITVKADQSAVSGSTGIDDATYLSYDLLYCPPTTATYPNPNVVPVNLVFFHQMARVIVTVNSSSTEQKESVDKIEFGGGRVKLAGTITNLESLTTSDNNGATTWTTSGTGSTITMRDKTTRNETTHKADGNIYTFECILPPQSDGTATTELIKITTSGAKDADNNGIARTYTYKNGYTLQAGYQYTYSLNISEKGSITISTVKVEGWSSPTNVNNTATIPSNSYPD